MRPEREREYVEFVTVRLAGLRRLAYSLTGDAHRGDDLVQQTLIAVYVRWHRMGAVANLDGYVRAMLVRFFLSERRRSWSARVDLTDVLPDRAWPERSDLEDRAVLRAVLNRLPPRQRAVLVLRYLCDLPVAEVAEMMGCSPGTVKSQTAHGLSALRRLLGYEAPAAWAARGVESER